MAASASAAASSSAAAAAATRNTGASSSGTGRRKNTARRTGGRPLPRPAAAQPPTPPAPPPPPPPPPSSASPYGWSSLSDSHLEDLILTRLGAAYHAALARLRSLGYDEPLALRALLNHGHRFGCMDILSNILHNALAFLNDPSPAPPVHTPFSDLRTLQIYTLSGMIGLLQNIRPHYTRGDALWCLYMSDLHLGRAATMDIAYLDPPNNNKPPARSYNIASIAEDPKKKKPVARQTAPKDPDNVGEAAKPTRKKPVGRQTRAVPKMYPPACAVFSEHLTEDNVASVMKGMEGMSIGEETATEDGGDEKKEMIFDVMYKIRELEVQVKERKEWAQMKALQAARKLSDDMAEMNMLRAERDETQRKTKEYSTVDESLTKQLNEMEATLKEATGEVDCANETVRQLEVENASIRAEIAAAKLRAAESNKKRNEMAKRENKSLKRLQAQQKQKEKIEGEIADERRKIAEVQQQLIEVHEAQKETEVKWKQAIKAKELAIAEVEKERKAKESADIRIKREHEALRQKMEVDIQRHKDDVSRLEEELSRLKASARTTQLCNSTSKTLGSVEADICKPLKEANTRVLKGSNKLQESPQKMVRKRGCVECKQDEASVLFLPCAHQVICVGCNEKHKKVVRSRCPSCKSKINERIRVYGTSS